MIVTVIDRERQKALWGKGYRSITQVLRTIEIADACPSCGKARGNPSLHRFCEDGEWYDVSCWTNPCGHLDRCKDVIREAEQLSKDTI
ncbi:MAG: hypothetical protein AAGC79_06110 [Pseudomonadota bacterium]